MSSAGNANTHYHVTTNNRVLLTNALQSPSNYLHENIDVTLPVCFDDTTTHAQPPNNMMSNMSCEKFYITKGRNKNVLLCMCIGMIKNEKTYGRRRSLHEMSSKGFKKKICTLEERSLCRNHAKALHCNKIWKELQELDNFSVEDLVTWAPCGRCEWHWFCNKWRASFLQHH